MIFNPKPVVSNQVIISSMFALLLVLWQSCLDVALTFLHRTPRHVGEKRLFCPLKCVGQSVCVGSVRMVVSTTHITHVVRT